MSFQNEKFFTIAPTIGAYCFMKFPNVLLSIREITDILNTYEIEPTYVKLISYYDRKGTVAFVRLIHDSKTALALKNNPMGLSYGLIHNPKFLCFRMELAQTRH